MNLKKTLLAAVMLSAFAFAAETATDQKTAEPAKTEAAAPTAEQKAAEPAKTEAAAPAAAGTARLRLRRLPRPGTKPRKKAAGCSFGCRQSRANSGKN